MLLRTRMKEKVENIIRNIRPYLQSDGGDIQLVSVSDDGVVRVRLTGACKGCPMAAVTLKNRVEAVIKREIPEIRRVIAV
jgi:Fe-S cluster biogenesis protein NfuA